MNNLFIKGTSQTPHIDFRIDENYFIISGRSVPEDCDIYYYPVIRFLEIYKNETENKIIKFEFRLIYYNTTSIRYLNSVMHLIEAISVNNEVSLKWYYDSDDEYLEEMGEYFKESYDIDFKLIKQILPPKKTRKKLNN